MASEHPGVYRRQSITTALPIRPALPDLMVFFGVLLFVLSQLVTPALAGPLNNRDMSLAQKVFSYLDQEEWKKAARLAAKIENQDAKDLVHWVIVSEPHSGATFEGLSDFLLRYPHWPNLTRIQRRAEELMPVSMTHGAALGWFERHPPVSTDGKMRQANALMALGQTKKGIEAVRDTWINGTFGRTQFKNFYQRNKKHLTHDDHVQRLERLIWSDKYSEARSMLYRVNKDTRALAEARLLLMRMKGDVDRAIDKVPNHLKNHAGLVYERLRWRRRKGLDAGARELLEDPPADLIVPEKWWRERRYLARRALDKNDYVEAYLLAVNHEIDQPGAELAEAEWLAGWIALRYLDKPKTALSHFQKLYQSVNFPISKARGAYWIARSLDALKQPKAATGWYKQAANFPTTYYGQLAWAKVYPDRALVLPDDPALPLALSDKVAGHPLTQIARILAQLGEQDRIRPFIKAIIDNRDDPAWKAMGAQLAGQLGRPDMAIDLAKAADREGLTLPSALYPTLSPPAIPAPNGQTRPRSDLEVPLVLAMIRQESAFRPRAKSHANARGLMQIIPGTAYRVAKQLGLPYSKKKLLNDPVYNMQLGQAYLLGLLEDFDGSYVLALAGYNAGPSRARYWVKKNGNPTDPSVDAIDWVERIPFDETRNYVQRVLENTQAYRFRLKAPKLAMNLAQDLER